MADKKATEGGPIPQSETTVGKRKGNTNEFNLAGLFDLVLLRAIL